MLRTREGLQIGKDGVPLQMTRVAHAEMLRVCIHGLDARRHRIRIVREVDAIAEGLGHLCLAVCARETAGSCVARNQRLRLHEHRRINRIELPDNLSRLLDHRQLILTDRHRSRLKGRDIRRLADRIGEEADRDIRLEIPELNLILHGRVALQSGDRDEIRVEEGELSEFRDLRLNKECGLLGIESHREIVECHFDDVLSDLLGIVKVVGERLRVRNHDHGSLILAGILQRDSSAKRTHIVAHVQSARRAVSG